MMVLFLQHSVYKASPDKAPALGHLKSPRKQEATYDSECPWLLMVVGFQKVFF